MSERRSGRLGPSELFVLRSWGVQLWKCFGQMPYLVGSCARDEPFRDVDIRMLIPDAWAETLGWPALPSPLTGMNVAFSVWGQTVTGQPIDFQFQGSEDFHAHDGEVRNPVGMDFERWSIPPTKETPTDE